MKNNFLKYIFVVFVIILIIFAFYKLKSDEKENEKNVVVQKDEEQTEQIADDLRLPIVNFDTINPLLSNNKNVQDITKIIFEPLVTVDENYKLQNCLANEWSKSGDKSYIIKLKNNVKWHDGSKFTSKDVQFTIDRLKENLSIYSFNVQHVIEVNIIDDYTLKITLDEEDQNFGYKLTFPIVSNNFYLEQDFKTSEKNNIPVATGMYKVTSNDGSTITLKKNNNWWNISEKNAKIETITVNLYSSMGDAYNSFKMGNIDLITTQNTNIENYIGTIGYNKKEYKGRQYDFLAFNCSNNTIGKTEVRKAISYAIDKENIIASVYNGNYYNCNFPLDFGNWVYTSEDNANEYNPDQAKQILIDNGWELKYGYWQKYEDYKTLRLSFNITVNSEDENKIRVAEIIKSNLEAIGIKIKIYKVSKNQYENIMDNKSYDIILGGTNMSIGIDVSTYLGENNISNYNNEELKLIMNNIPNISDENLLKEKYKKIVQIYKDGVPSISLYMNKNIVAYNVNLIGDVTPNCYNIFYNIDKWYRQI